MLTYRRFHTRDGLVSQLYRYTGPYSYRFSCALRFSPKAFAWYEAEARIEDYQGPGTRDYELFRIERRVGTRIYHYYERE